MLVTSPRPFLSKSSPKHPNPHPNLKPRFQTLSLVLNFLDFLESMAQREKEETEVQFTETLTLTLCVNNCDLYGNPATNNLCNACFQAKIRPSPSGSGHKKLRSDPIQSVELDRTAAEDRTAMEVTRPLAAKKAVNRCLKCRKRVGLTGFRCRCGDMFCGDHRYSDRHQCGFDYKTVGRERIKRDNPVVRAARIVRI